MSVSLSVAKARSAPAGRVSLSVRPSPDLRMVADRRGTLVVLGACAERSTRFAAAADSALGTGDVSALHALPGCFSSVLVRGDEAAVRTDPVGQFPFYAAESASDWHIGDHPADVAALVAAEVDGVALAARMVCPDACDLLAKTTPYAGVARLPLGHRWQLGGGHALLSGVDPIGPVAGTRLREAAEELGAALAAAVRARMALGRVTADFSGGVDSASLAFLAVRDAAELPVLTFRYAHAPVEDDILRARGYAELDSALRHHEITCADDDLPYRRLDADDCDPHPAALSAGHFRARLAVAAEHGDLHLVGEGGDFVLSASPVYLADLARRGDYAALWRHCVAWGRMRTAAPSALVHGAVLAASRGDGLRALARTLERPRADASWARRWTGPWNPRGAAWLRRKAAADLAEHVRRSAADLPAGWELADLVTAGQMRLQSLTQRRLRMIGHEYGVAVHAPFLDSAVVRACLALHGADRVRPDASKPLLAAALAGAVPAAVLGRTTKGDYTSSAHAGARLAASGLRDLLADDCLLAEHGLIEPSLVRPVLDDALRGLPVPWGALNQVFAVELWLRANEGTSR
ncbi:asparagine synthase-related protein [Actinokineospora guangxiensis]|uniref:Asparagine synthase-related protein n=1 Tax=Actinokineospora guangxiensis TaxID=1490288 RepID=A0ABW0EML8_9PSEU